MIEFCYTQKILVEYSCMIEESELKPYRPIELNTLDSVDNSFDTSATSELFELTEELQNKWENLALYLLQIGIIEFVECLSKSSINFIV